MAPECFVHELLAPYKRYEMSVNKGMPNASPYLRWRYTKHTQHLFVISGARSGGLVERRLSGIDLLRVYRDNFDHELSKRTGFIYRFRGVLIRLAMLFLTSCYLALTVMITRLRLLDSRQTFVNVTLQPEFRDSPGKGRGRLNSLFGVGWFFEWPQGQRPLNSTWPWSGVKLSIMVLWGVCWMFYMRIRFDSWQQSQVSQYHSHMSMRNPFSRPYDYDLHLGVENHLPLDPVIKQEPHDSNTFASYNQYQGQYQGNQIQHLNQSEWYSNTHTSSNKPRTDTRVQLDNRTYQTTTPQPIQRTNQQSRFRGHIPKQTQQAAKPPSNLVTMTQTHHDRTNSPKVTIQGSFTSNNNINDNNHNNILNDNQISDTISNHSAINVQEDQIELEHLNSTIQPNSTRDINFPADAGRGREEVDVQQLHEEVQVHQISENGLLTQQIPTSTSSVAEQEVAKPETLTQKFAQGIDSFNSTYTQHQHHITGRHYDGGNYHTYVLLEPQYGTPFDSATTNFYQNLNRSSYTADMSLSYESRAFMPDTQYPMQMSHDTQEQDEFKHDEPRYPSPPPPLSENPYIAQAQTMTATPEHSNPMELPDIPKEEEEEDAPSSPGRSKPVPKPDREVTKDTDGRFYCAWPGCTEEVKTFNRKCEWSKHMDKHDRPYRCKEIGCEKLPGFTYSGGLLRHEREVHGKHGGPKKQLNCPHPNCKRHTGKGFSRQENLNEHLRRVHTDAGLIQIAVEEIEEDGSHQAIVTGVKRKRAASKGDSDLREEMKRMKAENEELRRQYDAQQAQCADMMRQLVDLQNMAGLQNTRMAPQAPM